MKIKNKNGENRPELDNNLEHIPKVVAAAEIKKLIEQKKMPCTAYRQPFCYSLDNTENDRFQNFDNVYHVNSSCMGFM